MRHAILTLAGSVNMNHTELIASFVASYGSAWKEELSAMAEIARPGDRLAIDFTTNRIHAVTVSIEGDINVHH